MMIETEETAEEEERESFAASELREGTAEPSLQEEGESFAASELREGTAELSVEEAGESAAAVFSAKSRDCTHAPKRSPQHSSSLAFQHSSGVLPVAAGGGGTKRTVALAAMRAIT